MLFKIVLFLTLIGLHDIYSHGKACSIEFTAEQPNAYEMVGELSIGSSANLKSRHRRDTIDSGSPLSTTQAMRNYLTTIEKYMPAIRENIEEIERKFSPNYPLDQRVQRYDNLPDNISDRAFSVPRPIPKVEGPWKYQNQKRLFSPRREDDSDGEKLTGGENGEGVNQTVLSGFGHEPDPGVNWEGDDDERTESIREFENHKIAETDEISSNSNQNFMHSNSFDSDYDYFDGNVKDFKSQGMRNLCEECGRPINRFNSNKPLVININSDCPGKPGDAFNRISPQSRAHCRPFKSHQPPYQLPKYYSFNYRQMPRCYCH